MFGPRPLYLPKKILSPSLFIIYSFSNDYATASRRNAEFPCNDVRRMIVNRHRRFTYKLVDFFFLTIFFLPLYSSLRFFHTGLFFSSILLFTSVLGDFFFLSCSILHFYGAFSFSIGDFFLSAILLFTSF